MWVQPFRLSHRHGVKAVAQAWLVGNSRYFVVIRNEQVKDLGA